MEASEEKRIQTEEDAARRATAGREHQTGRMRDRERNRQTGETQRQTEAERNGSCPTAAMKTMNGVFSKDCEAHDTKKSPRPLIPLATEVRFALISTWRER
jgi:hypothetical protein